MLRDLNFERLNLLSDLPVENVICPLLNQGEQILIPDNIIQSRRFMSCRYNYFSLLMPLCNGTPIDNAIQ